MFRALFCTTLFVTLMVNIIFLFATKDKPPDPTAPTPILMSVIDGQAARGGERPAGAPSNGGQSLAFSSSFSYSSDNHAAAPLAASSGRRLFLRSNGDFYDYSTPDKDKDKDKDKRRDRQSVTTDDNDNEDNQSSQSSVTPGRQSDTLADANAHEMRVNKAAARVLARTQRRHAEAAAAPLAANDDKKELVVNVDGGKQRGGNQQLVPPTTSPFTSPSSTQPASSTKQIRIDNETTRRPIRPNSASHVGPPNGRSLARENNKRAPPASFEIATKTEIVEDKGNKSSETNIARGKELSSEITVITRRPPIGRHPDIPEESTNTITNTNTSRPGELLSIRVKSSKSHVLVRVDNLIIYESGNEAEGERDNNQQPSDDKHLFQQRHWHVRSTRRPRAPQRNANLPSARKEEKQQQEEEEEEEREEEEEEEHHKQSAEGAMRGIHVLVLNQFDGRLMAKRLFDTYLPQQDDELVLFLRQIQEGRLLVFAVQDEASFKMARSSRARKLMRRLGSQRIMELGWRDMWALVTIKRIDDSQPTGAGGAKRLVTGALAEGLSKSAGFIEWARPVDIEATFQLEPANSETSCAYEGDSQAVRARRRAFCSRVEGYGRVCDCKFPARLDLASKRIANTQLWDVPIVVLASNRPYYLHRMLRSLLSADGVDSRMITVFIDGFYDEPRWLCQLMNVRYQQHAPRGTRSARISHHYKTSLAMTFEQLFPQAKMAILFEEDLDVARDALLYFNHTRPLLEGDPSLYCASAWNDQGYEHSVGATTGGLLRIETMPGLGWMLTRQLFIEELKPRWPPATQQHDWDMWIRTRAVRRGRECVIPDVSRTYHFGSTGTNINSYFQREYFANHAFSGYDPSVQNDPQSIKFDDIATLERDNYERMLEAKLGLLNSGSQQVIFATNTTTLWGNGHLKMLIMSKEALCSYNSYDDKSHSSTTNHTLSRDERTRPLATSGRVADGKQENNTQIVIYIKMIDSEDFKNWLHLAKCWRLWDLDARGQHKAMWRVHLKGRQTFVVGVPASPYAKFKPAQLLPYDF